MKKSDFEYLTDSSGYWIWYKGKYIGGRILAKKQWGRAGSRRKVLHEKYAESEIHMLCEGRGNKEMEEQCIRVDEAYNKLKKITNKNLPDLYW